MKTVAQNSEYYQRLLKKLNDQETAIEQLQTQVDDLQKSLEKQRAELETSLRDAARPAGLEVVVGGAAASPEVAARVGGRYLAGELHETVEQLRALAH